MTVTSTGGILLINDNWNNYVLSNIWSKNVDNVDEFSGIMIYTVTGISVLEMRKNNRLFPLLYIKYHIIEMLGLILLKINNTVTPQQHNNKKMHCSARKTQILHHGFVISSEKCDDIIYI